MISYIHLNIVSYIVHEVLTNQEFMYYKRNHYKPDIGINLNLLWNFKSVDSTLL